MSTSSKPPSNLIGLWLIPTPRIARHREQRLTVTLRLDKSCLTPQMVALRNTSLLLPLKLFLSQSLRPNLRSHWHHLQVTPPSVSILPLLTPRHFLAKWQVTTELCEQIISALTTIDESNTKTDIVRSMLYLRAWEPDSLTAVLECIRRQ